MNQEVKGKWLKALRSGRYRQTTQRLRSVSSNLTSYCCLGVLCDLHSKETKMPWKRMTYLGRDAALPSDVRIWAGLATDDPRVNIEDTPDKVSLSSLNDGYGSRKSHSFKEIADIIESKL